MRCTATPAGYVREDGEPCESPEWDHCTARGRCSSHVEPGTLTCPRCLGKVRANLRRIGMLTPLLPAAAVEAGRVDSEAMNLAGPAADPEAWMWHQIARRAKARAELLNTEEESA